jgi:hypothetical protein
MPFFWVLKAADPTLTTLPTTRLVSWTKADIRFFFWSFRQGRKKKKKRRLEDAGTCSFTLACHTLLLSSNGGIDFRARRVGNHSTSAFA